jgi:hypothetical protein
VATWNASGKCAELVHQCPPLLKKSTVYSWTEALLGPVLLLYKVWCVGINVAF